MTLAILYGLASALTWGAADFGGGIASKKNSPYAVVIWGDLVGMVVVGVLAIAVGDPLPSWRDMIFIVLSSICGAIGVIILYRALAGGQMSIAAPVSALMAGGHSGLVVSGWLCAKMADNGRVVFALLRSGWLRTRSMRGSIAFTGRM